MSLTNSIRNLVIARSKRQEIPWDGCLLVAWGGKFELTDPQRDLSALLSMSAVEIAPIK